MTPERERRAAELAARYPQPQSALIPFLQYCQAHDGYVTQQAIHDAAEMAGITPGEAESIASFYTLLFKEPAGKHKIQVCRTLSCMLRGADELQQHVRQRLGLANGESSPDGRFYYEEVECLAACDRAPCLQHNLEFHYDVTPEDFDRLLDQWRASDPDVSMPAE
jgi:NADH-quinone oxidoreductase subunit E